MSFYENIAATALRLISEKGRNVTYRAFTTGNYNPATGSVSGDSTTDTTVKMVVTRVVTQNIDNSTLQRGDRLLLIAAGVVVPNEKDRIVDGSDTFQIISVEEIKPADTAIVYKLQVRK